MGCSHGVEPRLPIRSVPRQFFHTARKSRSRIPRTDGDRQRRPPRVTARRLVVSPGIAQERRVHRQHPSRTGRVQLPPAQATVSQVGPPDHGPVADLPHRAGVDAGDAVARGSPGHAHPTGPLQSNRRRGSVQAGGRRRRTRPDGPAAAGRGHLLSDRGTTTSCRSSTSVRTAGAGRRRSRTT